VAICQTGQDYDGIQQLLRGVVGCQVLMRGLEPQRVAHRLDDVGQADLVRPCPVLEERSEAFVVVNAPGVSAVREFCAARLSDCKIPDFVNILHAPLPRNANGKLQKNTARAQWNRRAKSDPLKILPGRPAKGWHGGSSGPSLRTREPLECSTVA